MRRLVSVLAMAALSVGLLVPSADATTSPVTSYKDLPSGWTNGSIDCTSGAPVALSAGHVSGPSTPPSGIGSLRISETDGVSGGIEADFSQTEPSLSSLTAFDAYLYASSSNGVPAALLIEGYDPTTDLDYEFALPLLTPDQWVHLDAATATLSWDSWNDTTGADAASGADTLQSFLQASGHENVKLDQLVIAGSCDPGTFYVDLLNYAVGATGGTYDFEPAPASALANFNRSTKVLSGQTVTLGARLTHASVGRAGETVQLWAKSAGATAYRLLKSLTTGSTGAVSVKVAPTSTTTYQWRYTGDGTNNAPASGQIFTITTGQRVTVTSHPAAAPYRSKAVIKGRVAPSKAGVLVRLVRVASGKQVVVASGRTTPGGSFVIRARMAVRGAATYRVVAMPYKGEVLGQSSTFKIVTKR